MMSKQSRVKLETNKMKITLKVLYMEIKQHIPKSPIIHRKGLKTNVLHILEKERSKINSLSSQPRARRAK